MGVHNGPEYAETADDQVLIRGVPDTSVDLSRKLRRRKYQSGLADPNEHPFIDDPQPWMMIDIDSLECPSSIDPIASPEYVIEHAINELPTEFKDVSCHRQFSSSMGVDGGKLIKAHLWFWLTDKKTSSELRDWAHSLNHTRGYKLIDPVVFNIVQTHYTAAPVFEGVVDPLTKRSGLLSKKKHSVDLVVSSTTTMKTTPTKASGKGVGLISSFFDIDLNDPHAPADQLFDGGRAFLWKVTHCSAERVPE